MRPHRFSIFGSCLALLLVVSSGAHAQWPASGFLLPSYSIENGPIAVSDGLNGTIVVWNTDPVESGNGVYVARLDASGAMTWGPTSLSFGGFRCSAASDGQGGAVIAWMRNNGGSGYDIRANRISRTGSLLWVSTGVVVCGATGDQWNPRVTTDNSGGAIVTWWDQRSDGGNIYVQRVNSSGATVWTANGVALCTAANTQQEPRITADGSGGAIVAWQDDRAGSSASDIYARRVNSAGTALWTANGVAVCTAASYQFINNLIADGTGGAILAWDDARVSQSNYDVFAQRLNSSGTPQWTANGVNLSSSPVNDWGSWIAADASGGAYVAYEHSGDIYMSHVASTGSVLWLGNNLCTAAGTQNQPNAAPDGKGGVLLTWSDSRSGDSDVYAQSVNPDGSFNWDYDGVALCVLSGEQIRPSVTTDLKGGALVAFRDGSDALQTPPDYVRASRVTAAGIANPQEMWTTDGLSVSRGSGVVDPPVLVKDPGGGVYATWSDTRTNAGDIYLQHLNAAGFVDGYWPADGLNLSAVGGLQNDPAMTAEATTVTVAWQDHRSTTNDIYAQRVSRDGSTLSYAANGIAVCTAAGDQNNPSAATDGAASTFVAWEDARAGGSNLDVYAQKLIGSGTSWTANGVAVTTAAGNQLNPQSVYDNAGGVIIGWSGGGLLASRLGSTGALVWGPVTLDASTSAFIAQGAPDAAGGAFFAYTARVGPPPPGFGSTGSVVQRISSSGTLPWVNPIFLSASSPNMLPTGAIRMRPDGLGGIVACYRQGQDVPPVTLHVNRVQADGSYPFGWQATGPVVANEQSGGTICEDGTGGALVAWSDGSDIRIRRVVANGGFDPSYAAGGTALCGETGTQDLPALVLLGTGTGIGVWRDGREGTMNAVFAGRTTFDGVPPGTVTDMTATFGRYDASASWTAPGDDGSTGTAVSYDFRYASQPITTEAAFVSATPYSIAPPDMAGTPTCVWLYPLLQCSSYYFAVRTTDEAGNQSAISNSPGGATRCTGYVLTDCTFALRTTLPDAEGGPLRTELARPQPNPIRATGLFAYSVATHQAGDRIQLAIFDLAGRRVRMIEDGYATAGAHQVSWNLRTDRDTPVLSGVYYARLEVGDFRQTRMIVVR